MLSAKCHFIASTTLCPFFGHFGPVSTSLGRHRRDKHEREPFLRRFTAHGWVGAMPTPHRTLPEIPVKPLSRAIWPCEKLQASETKSLTTKSLIDAKGRSVIAAR